MAGQLFIDSRLSIVSQNRMESLMCFTCATYTYLSFLIIDEIPRVGLN